MQLLLFGGVSSEPWLLTYPFHLYVCHSHAIKQSFSQFSSFNPQHVFIISQCDVSHTWSLRVLCSTEALEGIGCPPSLNRKGVIYWEAEGESRAGRGGAGGGGREGGGGQHCQ